MKSSYLNKYKKLVKKCIKRKVSLTAATIVSLLITGQVALAMDNFTNSEIVTASGYYSHGVSTSFGVAANIGTVIASGERSIGLYSEFGTATNSGIVIASGKDSAGLYSLNGILTNSGVVTASGDGSRGLASINSVDEAITNSGTVTASGDGSIGLYSRSGSITNSGTVTASGSGSYGLYSRTGIIINSGTITALPGTYAVYSTVFKDFTNDGTLELKTQINGSDIVVPKIYLSGGNIILCKWY
jgi:hypothetical protein